MSILQLVFHEGKPCALPVRVCGLSVGSEVEIPATAGDMPETHPRECGTDSEENPMAERTLEQQIEFIEKLAERQFPDPSDQVRRMEYRLELTTQKLREYAAKVVKLEVRQM